MSYQQLGVWQKAIDLAVAVYEETERGAMARDYGLRDQLRRASVSISSNIAEGEERGSAKDTIRFLYISKGSSAELLTQLWIAERIGYMPPAVASRLRAQSDEVSRMLRGLIQAKEPRSKSPFSGLNRLLSFF